MTCSHDQIAIRFAHQLAFLFVQPDVGHVGHVGDVVCVHACDLCRWLNAQTLDPNPMKGSDPNPLEGFWGFKTLAFEGPGAVWSAWLPLAVQRRIPLTHELLDHNIAGSPRPVPRHDTWDCQSVLPPQSLTPNTTTPGREFLGSPDWQSHGVFGKRTHTDNEAWTKPQSKSPKNRTSGCASIVESVGGQATGQGN